MNGTWLAATRAAVSLFLLPLPAEAVPSPAEEEQHSHEEAVGIVTEDPILKEQIVKIADGLKDIHNEMARRRKEIQAQTNETKKSALYAELDDLRKEHDMLERLLHDLVEEATANEWTKIDEALKRAKAFERRQEGAYQREENLRERKQ